MPPPPTLQAGQVLSTSGGKGEAGHGWPGRCSLPSHGPRWAPTASSRGLIKRHGHPGKGKSHPTIFSTVSQTSLKTPRDNKCNWRQKLGQDRSKRNHSYLQVKCVARGKPYYNGKGVGESGTAQHLTQSPLRGKGTQEEVTPSQGTSPDSPNTKSSLEKRVWSWGTAQKKSKCNCVSTWTQPWHPNTWNVTRQGHRRIIHGNLHKGLARNRIKSNQLIIMGRHVVIIAVSRVHTSLFFFSF